MKILPAAFRLSENNPRWILFFAALVCFAPFLNRPVFVDDHAHFGQAIERGHNLTQVYSAAPAGLGWTVGEKPSEANGPVYFYTMGLFTRMVGTQEWKAHLLIFGITLLGLFSFFNLARRYTAHPLWASLLWLTTPHVWLTANSLLLDALLAPLILIGLTNMMTGWEKNAWPRLLLGAVCLGLAPLVKYTGFLGLGAFVLWVALENKQWRTARWISFLLPIGMVVAWVLLTRSLYQESHLAAVLETSLVRPSLLQGYFLLAFLSGTAPVIALAPAFAFGGDAPNRRAQAIAVVVLAALLAVGLSIFSKNVAVGFQLGFWAALGGIWLGAFLEPRVRATGPSRFLSAWVGLGLAGLLVARGWFCARYFVVVGPAVILLTVSLVEKMNRRLADSFTFRSATLSVFALLSALLAFADLKAAWIDKTIATDLNRENIEAPSYYPSATLSGLSYYMDPQKWTAVGPGAPLKAGDQVILPSVTLPERFFPAFSRPQLIGKREFCLVCPCEPLGAYSGFYGSVWGPLPFSVSQQPQEVYLYVRNTEDASSLGNP